MKRQVEVWSVFIVYSERETERDRETEREREREREREKERERKEDKKNRGRWGEGNCGKSNQSKSSNLIHTDR